MTGIIGDPVPSALGGEATPRVPRSGEEMEAMTNSLMEDLSRRNNEQYDGRILTSFLDENKDHVIIFRAPADR